MLNQYDNVAKAIIFYLKLLNVKVNSSTINDVLNNHPDWPSLLCISDSLSKWNIPNAAGKIEKIKIQDLPTPFLACMNNNDDAVFVVTKIDTDCVSYFSPGSNKIKDKEPLEEFFNKWNGI
jgi:ABC-type bacteriocin/lantibiotic exporter with double-glycine peptidase domain